MTFLELKTNIQSALGRTDIPDYIYTLVTADMNRDIRTLDMQSVTTLAVSSELTNLPSDFLEVVSVYVDDDVRTPLQNMTANEANYRRKDSGEPWGYAIVKDQIKLIPTPDGSYNLSLRYIAELADLSADSDTNVILQRYPNLYIYGALRHAAVWAQDVALSQTYDVAYKEAQTAVEKAEYTRRHSGPLVMRPYFDMAPR